MWSYLVHSKKTMTTVDDLLSSAKENKDERPIVSELSRIAELIKQWEKTEKGSMARETAIFKELASEEYEREVNYNWIDRIWDEDNYIEICPARGWVISKLVLDGTEIFYNNPERMIDIQQSPRWSFAMFPQAGPLDKEWQEESWFALRQHGFMRDEALWQPVIEENAVRYPFTSNELTKEEFPFDFFMVMNVEISWSEATIRYEVTNNDTKPMPIAPGYHTYFAVDSEEKDNITFDFKGGKELEWTSETWNTTKKFDHPWWRMRMNVPWKWSIYMDVDSEVFNRVRLRSELGEWKDFFCLEPTVWWKNGLLNAPIMIQPWETFEFSFTFWKEKDE